MTLFLAVGMYVVNKSKNVSSTKVYKREAILDLVLPKGAHRYLPMLLENKECRLTEIKVNHRPRFSGKSKYGLKRIFLGFFDLFRFRSLAKKNKEISLQSLYEIKEKYGFKN